MSYRVNQPQYVFQIFIVKEKTFLNLGLEVFPACHTIQLSMIQIFKYTKSTTMLPFLLPSLPRFRTIEIHGAQRCLATKHKFDLCDILGKIGLVNGKIFLQNVQIQ